MTKAQNVTLLTLGKISEEKNVQKTLIEHKDQSYA